MHRPMRRCSGRPRYCGTIEKSSRTAVFLSDATAKSKWVGWEIDKSMEMGKHVLGVYPQDAKPTNLPEPITKNKIKCVSWLELASTIAKLK